MPHEHDADLYPLAVPTGRAADRAPEAPPAARPGTAVCRPNDRPRGTPRHAARAGGLTQDPPPVPPFVVPLLPGRTLERMCRVLRGLWRTRGVWAYWALYVHVRWRRWVVQLPPQWAAAVGPAVPPFPPLIRPGRKLRLAGTCATAAPGDADPARGARTPALPLFDGLHLLWRPGRPWLDAAAYVTTAGTTVPVPLDRVIDDDPGPGDRAACQRVYVRTPAWGARPHPDFTTR